MNYKPREIIEVIDYDKIGYPEWISIYDQFGNSTHLSMLDDCKIRYRTAGQDHFSVLCFRRCSGVYYDKKKILIFNENDLITESIEN